MERRDRLQRLFTYDAWANGEAFGSARELTEGKSLRLLAHVLGAGRLWLDRLRGSKPKIAVWPELTPERLGAEIADLERAWSTYLGGLVPEDFGRTIEYVNSKGERWSSTVEDVLSHVLLHGAYHRGQVAAEVRARGLEPAATDFIHAARQGFLD